MSSAWCKDCREGEHGNYSDEVYLVSVYEPLYNGKKRLIRTQNMCIEHIRAHENDGYIIIKRVKKE